MKKSTWVYLPISAATAILITVGRGGIFPIFGDYSILDRAMNWFVVLLAPIFAAIVLLSRPIARNLRIYFPILLLWIWVVLRVFFSPTAYWPPSTVIITILLSLLIPPQIRRSEINYVRYFVLGICLVFNIMVFIYYRDTITFILNGSFTERLGVTLSPANVVAYPRVVYTFVFTCFVTVLIDKRKWLRIVAASLLVLPLLIGLASGTRGILIGFITAIITFILGQYLFSRHKWRALVAIGLFVILILYFGITEIQRLFPLLVSRIELGTSGDSFRIAIWRQALSNITFLGNGVTDDYPHNIFLEFLKDYGIMGLLLFLLLLIAVIKGIWKLFTKTIDFEVLWVIGLFALQMVSQQFSLSIYMGSIWAVTALVLALGRGEKNTIIYRHSLQKHQVPIKNGDALQELRAKVRGE